RRSGASARFVFLSAYLTDTYVEAALALAPSGYLTKSAGIPDIADAVRSVHAGRNFFDDAVAARLSDGLPRGGTRSRLGRLTPREREVLRLVASDLSCKEIAQRLNL